MGERVFSTGATRNNAEGKGRYDLVPPCAIRRVAQRYELGAKQHGDSNWKKGIPNSSLFDSAFRHLMQAMDGQTDEDHLAAAAWNIFALMWNEENIKEENNGNS